MPDMNGIGFYDANDIAAGGRWDATLCRQARNSTFIALRTDHYRERAWCMQEIIEAEDARAPVLIVDARTSLSSGPAWPPLDSAQSIRWSQRTQKLEIPELKQGVWTDSEIAVYPSGD